MTNPYELFRLKNLLGFLAPKPSELVLDVGSGGGTYTRSVAERSTVVALDLSRGAIESAKENLRRLKTVFFIVSDVDHLPFKEKSVDSILCIDVVEHLARVDRSLDEMARVLKPFGKICIFTACGYNKLRLEYIMRPLFGRLLKLIYLKIGHFRAFSTKVLLELLEDNFVEVKIQYMYPWIGSWLNFLGVWLTSNRSTMLEVQPSQKIQFRPLFSGHSGFCSRKRTNCSKTKASAVKSS